MNYWNLESQIGMCTELVYNSILFTCHYSKHIAKLVTLATLTEQLVYAIATDWNEEMFGIGHCTTLE